VSTVFAKLNWKSQSPIVVLHAPENFAASVDELRALGTEVYTAWGCGGPVSFALAFGVALQEVEAFAGSLKAHTDGDAVVWFAYPKQSSKRYRCEFNRDTGWKALGDVGFEPVRQVSIDDDWSALRFRRVQFIKSLKRDASRVLSAEGKARAAVRPVP
jgi:hypothetical protein